MEADDLFSPPTAKCCSLSLCRVSQCFHTYTNAQRNIDTGSHSICIFHMSMKCLCVFVEASQHVVTDVCRQWTCSLCLADVVGSHYRPHGRAVSKNTKQYAELSKAVTSHVLITIWWSINIYVIEWCFIAIDSWYWPCKRSRSKM